MNSSPRPYLKVARLQSTQRGMSSTSSCSTLTHSTGPIPSGKSKTSGSLNGGGGVPATVPSQITGGLRHSSIVVHIENDGAKISLPLSSVTTRLAPSRVPSSSISREQVVGGVPREHVGQAGLDADPAEGQPSRALPEAGLLELLVAELDAALLVRRDGVRAGQAHRHVEVVGAGGVRAVEDRHVEDRVDGVHDMRDPVLLAAARSPRPRRGVDLRRRRSGRRRAPRPPSSPAPGRSRRPRRARRSRAAPRSRRRRSRRRRRRPEGFS